MNRRERATVRAPWPRVARMSLDLFDHHGAERALDYLALCESAITSDGAFTAWVHPQYVLEAHRPEV